MKKKLNTQSGFTLPEILISMVVIGISIVVIARMDNYSLRGSLFLNKTNNALLIIDNTIEALRLSIVRDDSFDGLTDDSFTKDGITVSYKFLAAYSPVNSTVTLDNVKQIEIVAKWKGSSSKTDSICVTSCLARQF